MMISVCVAYIVIVSIITIIISLILASVDTGKQMTDPIYWERFRVITFNTNNYKNILAWALVVGMTQLLMSMNDKFGQGLLWDFIKGKYHTPREETRVFMFVDLKSSTTIAEKLGNEKYYNLLRDFYADITDAIIYNKGEVYQYVGDEIVISWMLENGIENSNCVKCYFDMQEAIQNLKDKYLKKYDLIPEFKAGLHYGKVIAGEIGIIKRDITFSGDVLNTAARIQSQCNEHDVTILSSNELLDLMPLTNFKQTSLGSIMLKGKEQGVELSTVEIV